MSRIQRISGLSQFFRDTALWQYDDVPGHTLIGAGDAPRYLQNVPWFIPEQDLDRLMPAIDALACPFQRAALLVARWSGARRTEIQRHVSIRATPESRFQRAHAGQGDHRSHQ